MNNFKPMLACDHDPAKLQYPVYASPKIDGLRAAVVDGKLVSRSLKSFPNRYVSSILSSPLWEGFDGELVAGLPTAPNAMQEATSFFMSQDKVGPFTWYVFDKHDIEGGYDIRLTALADRFPTKTLGTNIRLLEQTMINNEFELAAYESEQIALGYEGVILRKIDGRYKYGRSTVNEGLLLKVKRFTDGEARVLGFEEQMFNGNEATTNELGRTKRSSHKAGLVGKGALGALIVEDLVSGVQFNVGTGLNDGMREHIWANRDSHEGRIVKYKSFLVGVKTAPRHPVFLGFRDERDMS
jgi:DNA ligase-1